MDVHTIPVERILPNSTLEVGQGQDREAHIGWWGYSVIVLCADQNTNKDASAETIASIGPRPMDRQRIVLGPTKNNVEYDGCDKEQPLYDPSSAIHFIRQIRKRTLKHQISRKYNRTNLRLI